MVPLTLSAKVFSISASSISRNLARRTAAPAELKRKWTRLNAASERSADGFTPNRLVTSTFSDSPWLPMALTSAAASRAPFSLMSAHTTLAPSRAKISAVARPIPLAAPVMRMVFPAKWSGVLGILPRLSLAATIVHRQSSPARAGGTLRCHRKVPKPERNHGQNVHRRYRLARELRSRTRGRTAEESAADAFSGQAYHHQQDRGSEFQL